MQRLGSQLIIIITITESNCVYSSSCSNNNKLKCRCTARLFITTNAIIIIYPCKLGWRRGGGDGGVFNSNEVNSAGKSVTTSLQQSEALPCSPPASDGSSSNRYSLPENNFFVSPTTTTTTTFLSSTDHIFRSNYRHQNYISRVAF